MAPKLPGKFDDISKKASSVLKDDFQCDSYQFNSKSKTAVLGGGSAELAVDLFAKGEVQTPAKLTFKLPKAYLEGLSLDKFELDKGGKSKLELSAGKALHKVDGLKLAVASSFPSKDKPLSTTSFAVTYTGLADTSVKVESKPGKPTDVSVECLHGHGPAVIGAKLDVASSLCPSVGVNFTKGDIFASIFAKNKFSEFNIHSHYTVANAVQVAATYQHGGSKDKSWSIGASTKVLDGTAKAKYESSVVSLAYKKDLAKGTTLLAGMNYNTGSGAYTFGGKVNVE